MKIVVYTSAIGVPHLNKIQPNFTGEGLFKENVMEAKIYKILPHLFLNCDISIWLDSNIESLVSPEQLVKEFLQNSDIAMFNHPERKTLYEEATLISSYPPFQDRLRLLARMKAQTDFYRTHSMGLKTQLHEAGLIIRRHSKLMETFNNTWWAEICWWQERDQVSFPAVIERFNSLKLNTITGNIRTHPYFKFHYK